MDQEEIRGFCEDDMWEPWDVAWCSWGSPIGLSLGFVLFCLGVGILLTSIGFFIYLLHFSGLVGC